MIVITIIVRFDDVDGIAFVIFNIRFSIVELIRDFPMPKNRFFGYRSQIHGGIETLHGKLDYFLWLYPFLVYVLKSLQVYNLLKKKNKQ